MSAVYAAKYAGKQAHNNRVKASQFNWSDYEIKFALDKNCLDVIPYKKLTPSGYEKISYRGGDKKWLVMEESVPISVINERTDPLKGVYEYLDGLSEKGVLVSPNKTDSPLKGGFCKMRGDPRLHFEQDFSNYSRVASRLLSETGATLNASVARGLHQTLLPAGQEDFGGSVRSLHCVGFRPGTTLQGFRCTLEFLSQKAYSVHSPAPIIVSGRVLD